MPRTVGLPLKTWRPAGIVVFPASVPYPRRIGIRIRVHIFQFFFKLMRFVRLAYDRGCKLLSTSRSCNSCHLFLAIRSPSVHSTASFGSILWTSSPPLEVQRVSSIQGYLLADLGGWVVDLNALLSISLDSRSPCGTRSQQTLSTLVLTRLPIHPGGAQHQSG
jgi:hypothetical protein